jgi:hypothetical protein
MTLGELHMHTIDLTGPQGNAFFLLGLARSWASQVGKDPSAMCAEMMQGDYTNLVAVFCREYGALVTVTGKETVCPA